MTVQEGFIKGLEGIIAAKSSICYIDGLNASLIYRGYDIKELAPHSTFEETCFLLWNGRLPTRDELQTLQKNLQANYSLEDPVTDLLNKVPPKSHPMDVLKTAVSLIGLLDKETNNHSFENNLRKAIRLTAKMGTIVAYFHNIRNGREPIKPDSSLSLAGNFLYMLNGQKRAEYDVRVLDAILILHADHDLNASTFTARVTASTESDIYSAITSGIGALKGPLHGGANVDVMAMLNQIKDVSQVEGYIHAALASKQKIPGFGHRVYKVEDPRATILREMARKLGELKGNMHYFETTKKIEDVVTHDKRIYPNVDLYSPSCYALLGIPSDLFTCLFAMARVSGWTAHVMEQHLDNRLIRPLSEYTGKIDLKYTPIEERT